MDVRFDTFHGEFIDWTVGETTIVEVRANVGTTFMLATIVEMIDDRVRVRLEDSGETVILFVRGDGTIGCAYDYRVPSAAR